MDELFTKDNTEAITTAFGVTPVFSVDGARPTILAKPGHIVNASPSLGSCALDPSLHVRKSPARRASTHAPTRSGTVQVAQRPLRSFKSTDPPTCPPAMPTGLKNVMPVMYSDRSSAQESSVRSSRPRKSPVTQGILGMTEAAVVACSGPQSGQCLATPAGLGMRLSPVPYMQRTRSDGSAVSLNLACSGPGGGPKKPSMTAVKSSKDLVSTLSTSPAYFARLATAAAASSRQRCAPAEVRVSILEECCDPSGSSSVFCDGATEITPEVFQSIAGP